MNNPKSVTFSNRYVVFAVAILALTNLVNYMDRMVLSVLLPSIKEELLLSDTQLGLLTGFAFALFYAAFGIPIARWADRGVRRNIIALALTVWSAMTALSGAAHNFIHLLSARIGIGVGEAGCIPPGHSLISDYVPVERRSTAFGVHTAGATVGSFIGLALGGWLASVIGWRLTFLTMAVPGLVLAVVIRFGLREPPRGYADGVKTESAAPDVKDVLIYLWSCRSYIHLVAVFAIACFGAFGIAQWMPSYYVRSFELSTATVGFLFGTAFGIGSTIGTVAGGPLADRLMKRDRRWGCWIGIIAYAVALPCYVGVFLAPTAVASIALFMIAEIAASVVNAPLFSMIQSVVSSRMRALASAVTMFGASVVGLGGGPFVTGVLSDLLAPRFGDESLRYALMIMALFLGWPIFHFWRASKTIRQDIERIRPEHQGGSA
jgi:predicted MFS family arabinose efflux permease